jgi:hypothetical protein
MTGLRSFQPPRQPAALGALFEFASAGWWLLPKVGGAEEELYFQRDSQLTRTWSRYEFLQRLLINN